jgi:uncharacterized alpha-E superfamily protein
MLSRVADNLYWMSRYLERAEHTARLIDVNLNLMLDQSSDAASERWDRVLVCLNAVAPPQGTADPVDVVHWLTFDPTNSVSIMAHLSAARENARQVREQISSEMWEQLNRAYLRVRQTDSEALWQTQPHEFFRLVKDRAQLFQGVTDATMSHGEGWQFVQLGRYIERAGATALLLDTLFRSLLPAQPIDADVRDYLEWVGLLKSCTAFEAYCKVYTASVRPDRVIEFLLLNAEFPHSIRFAADQIQTVLRSLSRSAGAGGRAGATSRVERLAGRLQAALDYAQVDEIMSDDVHAYLASIQHQCGAIHTAIYDRYIAYPIDVALAAQQALISSQ